MDRPLNDSVRSLTEKETILPCHYQPSKGNVTVQVTWYKESEMIITAHYLNGQTGQLSSHSLHSVSAWKHVVFSLNDRCAHSTEETGWRLY